MAVILTERAAQEVKKVLEEQKAAEGTLLRVRVVGGGCSGFSYDLRFDNAFDDKMDSKYEHHGVSVVVDKKSACIWTARRLTITRGWRSGASRSTTRTP